MSELSGHRPSKNEVDILPSNDILNPDKVDIMGGHRMSKTKLVVLIFTLIMLPCFLTLNNAIAKDDWEFTGKYLPDAQVLAKYDAQYFELTCADRTDVMYENYARLHPDFRKYLNDASMRKRWRIALISGSDLNLDSFNFCFYRKLRHRWSDALVAPNRHSLIFCGGIVENLNEIDQNAADALQEMTRYAVIGRALPILILHSAINYKGENRARLSSDIIYYIQRHLRHYLNEKPPILEKLASDYRRLLKPDAGIDLDPARKISLDGSFATGEHLKVFEAIVPCQAS